MISILIALPWNVVKADDAYTSGKSEYKESSITAVGMPRSIGQVGNLASNTHVDVYDSKDFPGGNNNSSQIVISIMIVAAIAVIFLIFWLKHLGKTGSPKGSGEIKSIRATLLDSKKECLGGIGYITKYIFEDTSGKRIVLVIKPQDAEDLVIGDKGMLKYQGQKYISFTR
jgi:hypothetical protein